MRTTTPEYNTRPMMAMTAQAVPNVVFSANGIM